MLNYEIDGSMAVITGCTADEGVVSIPQTIDGHVVGRIAPNAFCEMPNIKAVTIPSSVKQIGEHAFSACKNLKHLSIAEGLEIIEDWCFINCPLAELNLPHSLKEIGEHAFLGTSFKEDVDKLIIKKKLIKEILSKLNFNACALPEKFNENLKLISKDFISTNAEYVNDQFIGYSKGFLKNSDMDVPLIFDDDTLMIALYTKRDISNFEFKLSDSFKETLDKIEEFPNNFMLLCIDIYGDGELVGSIIAKSPYASDVSFKILKISSKKGSEHNYYCVTLSTRISYKFNGNTKNIFSLNQFDELENKFKIAYANKLISKECLNKYLSTIDEVKLNNLVYFFKEVKGSPLLSYTIKLFDAALAESNLTNKMLKDYIKNKLKLYYNELASFDSFEAICFDVEDSISDLLQILPIELEDLARRYSIELTDTSGNVISVHEAKGYKKSFIDNLDNYKLYGKYLALSYIKMQKINNDYLIDKFINKEK